jgi:hypothetical protein
MRKKCKAHLFVREGNLAYLVFCLPFVKNKCAKLWDSKNGFVEADKTVQFSHAGLLSLVRSKCEVLCLTLKFDFSFGWLQVTVSRFAFGGLETRSNRML